MKIGVITFHRAINFGAVLQTYALNKYFYNLKMDSEVIDYHCEYIEDFYNPVKLKEKKTFYKHCKELIYSPFLYYKRFKFRRFVSRNVRLSENAVKKSQLVEITNKYDYFITGSDQVWNFKWTEFDKAYFLDFVVDTKKKNSFAASFGFSEIPLEYKQEYKELLSSFNQMSVREKEGQLIVKELLEKEIDLLPDPTCLLTVEEWKEVAKNPKKDNYILLYSLENSKSILEFTENLAKKTGCEIIYINDGFKKKINATYARFLSPQQFVGLFLNAKYIVTNSFHGTMYSIIFNKNFFVELQHSSTAPNSRLTNVLEFYNLMDRLIIEGKNHKINETIDYSSINKKLARERVKAEQYLKKMIGDNNVKN